MSSLIERSPFATIEIGRFETLVVLKQALIDSGYIISESGSDLMDRMKWMDLVAEPTTIELYRATNAELGLTEGGTITESFEAIAKIGGEKLPAEVGPYWRLNNPNQSLNQWELVYMSPLTARYGQPSVFNVISIRVRVAWFRRSVVHRLLNGAPKGHFYHAGVVWLFGRKRPSGTCG